MKKTEKKQSLMLAQANVLTTSRYNFNLIEKRCLYLIIKEVRRLYIDTNEGDKTLFNNMLFNITEEQLKMAGENKREAYDSLIKLHSRVIEIENDEIWLMTSFITVVEHYKKKKMFMVEVSSKLLPYLVELAGNFTTYDLVVAIALKSTYSQRFYELCSQYKNRTNRTFFYSVEDIREMLMLKDKYLNISHLKKYVLDVAQREIKGLYDRGECELWFDFSAKDTDGRKIISYFFQVYTREADSTLDFVDTKKQLLYIHEQLQSFIKRDKKYIDRVIKHLSLYPELIEPVATKFHKIILDRDRASIPKLMRWVMREDFGFEVKPVK